MSLCPGCEKDYSEDSINCVAHRNHAKHFPAHIRRDIELMGIDLDDNPPQGGIPDTAPPESPCRKALEMVYGDREDSYGHPSDNFDRIRALWTAYLVGKYGITFQLDRRDISWLNTLQKCARDQHNPIADNLIDTCGYAEAAFRAGEES